MISCLPTHELFMASNSEQSSTQFAECQQTFIGNRNRLQSCISFSKWTVTICSLKFAFSCVKLHSTTVVSNLLVCTFHHSSAKNWMLTKKEDFEWKTMTWNRPTGQIWLMVKLILSKSGKFRPKKQIWKRISQLICKFAHPKPAKLLYGH